MPSQTEIARLAAAVNLLRPDWPAASIQTFIASKHAHRPLQDLAPALVAVAADPTSTTPARIDSPGPWWAHTRPAEQRPPDPPRFCSRCSTLHYDDQPCGRRVAPEPGACGRGVAAARQILAEARANPSAEIPALPEAVDG
jgi:hypothetical protein